MTLFHSLPGGHAAFLAVAVATHALVGYALGERLADAPLAGLVGGVLADADFLLPAAWGFPLVHRGLTHTLLALAAVTALVTAVAGRRQGLGFGGAYAAHLAIDATTPMGVPLLYPLSAEYLGVVLGGHAAPATAVLWACSLGLLWRGDGWSPRPVRS
ncbi:metal-dependent hydrolase [Halostella litorea]|uniref:metal-dependent hydrolase n=1 Tax=Halostella litorea TaxID=2528831 RepID=UPI00192A24F3|nr:metal-dependent hydrolase [Halostella litorea]